jgi:tripartite ATP-independent transporter DctP family solute receptor
MLSLLPEKGIEGLALWEQGFREMTTASKEIRLPADVSGMKIRVMDSPTYIAMFNHLGALPTVTSMGELFTALQQGAVDGQENPINTIASRKFNEVQQYLIMTPHSYGPLIFGANKAFFDKLPEDVQAAIKEAAIESREVERQAAQDIDQQYVDGDLKATMTIIELTDDERNQWQEAVAAVYPEFKDIIGEEIYKLFGID